MKLEICIMIDPNTGRVDEPDLTSKYFLSKVEGFRWKITAPNFTMVSNFVYSTSGDAKRALTQTAKAYFPVVMTRKKQMKITESVMYNPEFLL